MIGLWRLLRAHFALRRWQRRNDELWDAYVSSFASYTPPDGIDSYGG